MRNPNGIDIKELEIQIGRKENEIGKFQVLLVGTKRRKEKCFNLLIVPWFLITFVCVLVNIRM